MQGLLWFLRLCLAALVLVAALVALNRPGFRGGRFV